MRVPRRICERPLKTDTEEKKLLNKVNIKFHFWVNYPFKHFIYFHYNFNIYIFN